MKKIGVVYFFILLLLFSITIFPERKIPCRINAEDSKIFLLTLGNPDSPIFEGYYFPEKDIVYLKNGKTVKDYYRNTLGIKFFKPIDKTHFKKPPSGWCSWYFYYQEISGEEILKNAEWISKNLREYGAEYIQIDDGWQGTGHGLGENRDWFVIDTRFRKIGMSKIAKKIKSMGLKPGLWLAPHGESSKKIVKMFKNAFFLSPEGSSLSSTWEGTFLVKPSKEGVEYLKTLFRMLKNWGYEYFKIDGQPIVVNEYKRLLGEEKGVCEYRKTLKAIRETIGKDSYLLGCWGIPIEGAGIFNGSRVGGDTWLGFSGYMVSVSATMKKYFLHNILWYNDPDVLIVREPLDFETAKAWATLQGITGQALMTSDMMYELPEERVSLLKRIFPAVNIKPADLFSSLWNKKIWVLKVKHLERAYDIVSVFNYGDKIDGEFIDFEEIGLNRDSEYHIFDFWNQEYLGVWKGGYFVRVKPYGVTVLTIVEDKKRPLLISTSRHITQGWVELKSIKEREKNISGISHMIKGDDYTLSFGFPKGKCYTISKVEAGIPYKIFNYKRWGKVRFFPEKSGEYLWKIHFKRTKCYQYPVKKPRRILKVRGLNPKTFVVEWTPQYYLWAGYNVYIDDKLYGFTPDSFIKINLKSSTPHKIDIKTIWYDGNESEKALSYNLIPEKFFKDVRSLVELEPEYMSAQWENPKINSSIDGNDLRIGGKYSKVGLGTHANSKIKYYVGGIFSKLEGGCGIDDETDGNGSIECRIYGDGKILWRSGKVLPRDLKLFSIKIENIKEIVLEVNDSGDGNNYDHADWVNLWVKK